MHDVYSIWPEKTVFLNVCINEYLTSKELVCCIFLLPNTDEVAVDNFIRVYTPSICLQKNKK